MKQAQCVVLLAALTWIQHTATCLQVGPQQQQPPQQQQQQQPQQVVAVSEVTAVMAIKQQQQQQQQQQLQQSQQQTFVEQQQQPTSANQANQANQPSKQTPAKANHRLVSKLKDHARHRRRHRHNRHRHYLAERLKEPQGAATTLTALESIVEEVSRAGQVLPAPSLLAAQAQQQQQVSPQQQQQQQPQQPSQQQQQQPPQQQQPSSAANSAAEVLLDGSSSPVTHLVQQQQQQVPNLNTQMVQHQQPLPVMRPTSSSAGPMHNSRGFFLTSMLSKIMNVLNVTEFALEMREGISSRASCMACNAVVGLFMSPLYSKEVFSAAIRTVCTSFKIQSSRVCAGLAESFQDDFEFIRKNTKLTRDEICAVVFGVDCARRQTYNLFWTVHIPEPTKTLEPPDSGNPNTANGGGLPVLPPNEQAMTTMEDAPDLFEYRKSGAAAGASPIQIKDKQQQQPVGSSTARPSELHQAAQQSLELSKNIKSGKMLKRPQYIFDDDHLLEATNDSPSNTNRQENNNKLSTFVHITDIHIDPYYEPGSLNDCNEPLCCRATSGPVAPADKRRQAGRWGDYGNCDTPVRTLRSALNRIREQHSNAEYWIWTGDISPHDIWNISKSEAINNVRLVSKMMRDYSNGLPVFPVIGNHEAHPVNSFSTPDIKGKFSMSWLYDALADEWSEWLPKDALKTLRAGGFYKLQVRRGFRIIALNTNYCARLNPWSFYDPVDPANQLKWLVEELLEAELNQDKVHIIGHVPPDNRECTQAWLFNFINIVDRFKETIVAQFFGHTHRDEWRIIYSLKRQDEPIGVQYIGPSITPFTENNPAYRVYHQDRSGHLIDSETYYFNLTEANESPDSEPNWQYAYSWQTHLNLTQGTGASDWHHYVQKMYEDDAMFDSFFKRFFRSSDVKVGQVCRNKCKFQMLSDLRLSHPYKTKPKPFLANRKTSNHHRDRHDHHHHHHHHHHHKRLRHSD